MVRNVNIYSFADVLGLSNSQFTLIKLPFRILYHISVSAHEKVGRCADCSWCMKSVIIGACELALLFFLFFFRSSGNNSSSSQSDCLLYCMLNSSLLELIQ